MPSKQNKPAVSVNIFHFPQDQVSTCAFQCFVYHRVILSHVTTKTDSTNKGLDQSVSVTRELSFTDKICVVYCHELWTESRDIITPHCQANGGHARVDVIRKKCDLTQFEWLSGEGYCPVNHNESHASTHNWSYNKANTGQIENNDDAECRFVRLKKTWSGYLGIGDTT